MPTINQLFKLPIGPEILFNFLKMNGEEHEDYYIFSNVLYKKTQYNKRIEPFIAEIKPYYFESKKYYLERKLDYSRFITILRQICNINNIKYSKKMLYNKSTYEILYHINKTPCLVEADVSGDADVSSVADVSGDAD
jgi:hypothetical protein